MMKIKKIMFCGGGSAGHVMPNIALCEELGKRYECLYMGTDGIEREICGRYGIPFYAFPAPKFVRGKVLCNLALPFRLVKAIKRARGILAEVRPDLLFCKGGYVSLPPALAAAKPGIPVIAHESDLTPGLANRIISRRAEVTLTAFPETAERFCRGLYAGAPIRRDAMKDCGGDIKKARPTVIVFGGGSGSKVLNDCVRRAAPALCKRYDVIHICGKGNVQKQNTEGYIQTEFARDMGRLYAVADCAVARCGANSAFELIINRVPTLFIPLENRRSRGDQLQNARYFERAGVCRVLRQSQLNAATLADGIDGVMRDGELKKRLDEYNLQPGNGRIIAEIERYAGRQTD